MFEVNNISVDSSSTEAHATKSSTISTPQRASSIWSYVLDVAVLLAMGAVLFWGASTQFSNRYNDVTRYQCYAIAFWQGQAGLNTLGLQATSTSQCAFLATSSSDELITRLKNHHFPSFLINLVASQSTSVPFRALPPEYPMLTLIPFSLALLAPFAWYQVVFALLMLTLAAVIYFTIKFNSSTAAAIAFAFYLSLGSWATAAGRFDLIPAGLTLGAVVLVAKARWKWAFVLLALATLLKFYPVLLLVPFLIAQQMQYKEKWTAWRRWSALAWFIGICAGVMLISLALNVANTLMPFTYFFNRPFQVESFPGTLLWLGDHAGFPVQWVFTYQSLNFLSSLSRIVSPLSTLLLVGSLAYTAWLQWHGKINIYEASLLTVFTIMVTGKVLSPQYLIWVTPMVAFVGRANWRWVVTWGIVCALTTFVYPLWYVDIPHIQQAYPAIAMRDFLMLAMLCALLVYYGRIRKQQSIV